MKILRIIIITTLSIFLLLIVIGTLLPKSEIERQKKEKAFHDSIKKSVENITLSNNFPIIISTDTVGDFITIVNKTGKLFMENKLESVIGLVNANLKRFEGFDKAELLSQRGGAYFALGDKQKALNDYEEAIKLDSNNSSLINNLIETYVVVDNKRKAIEYFEKLKKVKNPSQFDIENCEKLIKNM